MGAVRGLGYLRLWWLEESPTTTKIYIANKCVFFVLQSSFNYSSTSQALIFISSSLLILVVNA